MLSGVYDEIVAMREACGKAHLKTILATGELGNLENVYKASMVCMQAGKSTSHARSLHRLNKQLSKHV